MREASLCHALLNAPVEHLPDQAFGNKGRLFHNADGELLFRWAVINVELYALVFNGATVPLRRSDAHGLKVFPEIFKPSLRETVILFHIGHTVSPFVGWDCPSPPPAGIELAAKAWGWSLRCLPVRFAYSFQIPAIINLARASRAIAAS